MPSSSRPEQEEAPSSECPSSKETFRGGADSADMGEQAVGTLVLMVCTMEERVEGEEASVTRCCGAL